MNRGTHPYDASAAREGTRAALIASHVPADQLKRQRGADGSLKKTEAAATNAFTLEKKRVRFFHLNKIMRNVLTLLGFLSLAALITSGCADAQAKLGRGIRNTCEVGRLGGLRASMEQTAVWDSPEDACTTGVVTGLSRSVARTGVGLYEIITFPFPPYHPVCTGYVPVQPVYPDNDKPKLADDPLYQSDTYIGFSSGETFGFLPGSRFDVLGD